KLTRMAGRPDGEPLQPEDWEASWRMHERRAVRAVGSIVRALPKSPRCGICGAPFAGWGARIAGPLGYQPSRKNPTICATCVELSPPGGMNMQAGVLFADLRGFTARSELEDPQETAALLRRFYRCAEDVLFPDAVIDKLIGDEVMALYLPAMRRLKPEGVPTLMLEHAQE